VIRSTITALSAAVLFGSHAVHMSGSVHMAPHLTVARLQYGGGGDWYANPSSLPNLISAINERTTLKVDPTEARVTLLDDRLFDYPFLHATGHGNIHFSDAEILRLREYLARGGFLHVDDNYGIDESFRREMARVYPDRPLEFRGPRHRRRLNGVLATHPAHERHRIDTKEHAEYRDHRAQKSACRSHHDLSPPLFADYFFRIVAVIFAHSLFTPTHFSWV